MSEKWLNVEESELFRSLVSEIENNYSPAVNNIRYRVRKLLAEHGYKWKYESNQVGLRVEEMESRKEGARMLSKGRKTISVEKVIEIKRMRLEGHSVRSIAKLVKVGEGTVKKYIKILESEISDPENHVQKF